MVSGANVFWFSYTCVGMPVLRARTRMLSVVRAAVGSSLRVAIIPSGLAASATARRVFVRSVCILVSN